MPAAPSQTVFQRDPLLCGFAELMILRTGRAGGLRRWCWRLALASQLHKPRKLPGRHGRIRCPKRCLEASVKAGRVAGDNFERQGLAGTQLRKACEPPAESDGSLSQGRPLYGDSFALLPYSAIPDVRGQHIRRERSEEHTS